MATSSNQRERQTVYEVSEKDLFWDECQVLKSGVLARWTQKNGEITEVLFVTTKPNQSAKAILAIYNQRAEIEEGHRQLKCFQSIETLPSKKFTHVVFRIIMGVIGYNLMNLFLNSEECATFEQYSLKTLRQRRRDDPNPKVMIYTATTFAVLRNFEFLPLILKLNKSIQQKLTGIFENLDANFIPI